MNRTARREQVRLKGGTRVSRAAFEMVLLLEDADLLDDVRRLLAYTAPEVRS